MTLSSVLSKAGKAVYLADAAILTLLVDQNVIGITTSVDIAGIIAALAAGFYGQQAVVNAKRAKSGDHEASV